MKKSIFLKFFLLFLVANLILLSFSFPFYNQNKTSTTKEVTELSKNLRFGYALAQTIPITAPYKIAWGMGDSESQMSTLAKGGINIIQGYHEWKSDDYIRTVAERALKHGMQVLSHCSSANNSAKYTARFKALKDSPGIWGWQVEEPFMRGITPDEMKEFYRTAKSINPNWKIFCAFGDSDWYAQGYATPGICDVFGVDIYPCSIGLDYLRGKLDKLFKNAIRKLVDDYGAEYSPVVMAWSETTCPSCIRDQYEIHKEIIARDVKGLAYYLTSGFLPEAGGLPCIWSQIIEMNRELGGTLPYIPPPPTEEGNVRWYYNAPQYPTDIQKQTEVFKQIKNLGFNLVSLNWRPPNEWPKEYYENILTAAKQADIYVMPWMGWGERRIKQFIVDMGFGGEEWPIWGWYSHDEPLLGGASKEGQREVYEALKRYDPYNRPVITTFTNTPSEGWARAWAPETFDIAAFDIYPYGKDRSPEEIQYYLQYWANRLSVYFLEAGKQVIPMVQGFVPSNYDGQSGFPVDIFQQYQWWTETEMPLLPNSYSVFPGSHEPLWGEYAALFQEQILKLNNLLPGGSYIPYIPSYEDPSIQEPSAQESSAQGFLGQEIEEECVIDQEIENGFERGKIPIGELVDYAELYASTTISYLDDMIENAQAAADAAYNEKTTEDLYDLPPEFKCSNCTPICHCTWFLGFCIFCTCTCTGIPGPFDKVAARVKEIKDAYDKIVIANTNIANLVTAEGKLTDEKGNEIDIPDQLNRWKLLNALTNSRNKLEQCIIGYGKVLKPEMTRKTLLDCMIALDKIYTGELVILPGFKYLGTRPAELCFENLAPKPGPLCYPYNSKYFLTNEDRQTCEENRDSEECEKIIQDLMQNFFCCEGVKD